ncbi:hypothetical protein V495_01889 [Pseudogymnoascus sp. VKM F-4514 (FW-929)]|nr:hypothetical protein V495_01889 [Pseudogymnoascus sp. VKM F-4514 (FW-929)]KFY68019.1 hypothetical protein V497_00057 [Pseudogymnoascus sp. VKM F-4516 (FW-969)]
MSSPIAEPIRVRTPTDRSSGVSVDFEGQTIQYNPAAHVTINDAFNAKRELTRRVSDNTCGASTFYPGIAPYPSVADCELLKTWVYSLHEPFTVSDPNNYHGLVSAGTSPYRVSSTMA